MQRTALLSCAAAAVLALAACNGDTTGPSTTSLSADEAQALGVSMAGTTSDALSDAFGNPAFDFAPTGAAAMDSVTTTETFTRTRTCPQGGTVTVAGTRAGVRNTTTHSGSWNETATRTDNACAHQVKSGVTVTINGAPNVALTSSHTRTNSVPGPWTHTEKGAFDWSRSDGKSGHCTVDVTATFDPTAHTLHVAGTVCNTTFDKTVTHSS
jgi:hypothetical protein